MSAPDFVTRFAPSPNGYLHIGHAFSALTAFRRANEEGGRFFLRLEDIDHTRCKPEYEEAIFEDLRWLGIEWEEPVMRQSDHFPVYAEALQKLTDLGLTYPCFCSRKDIARELDDIANAPHTPMGHPYPGTCRNLDHSTAEKNLEDGKPHAIRLNINAAKDLTGNNDISFEEETTGIVTATPEALGDIILKGRDYPVAYHLAVVIDDAAQGITHVIRGRDLFEATHIHRLLQEVLELPVPIYDHHDLINDANGERIAKRDGGHFIRTLREKGMKPSEIRALIPLTASPRT